MYDPTMGTFDELASDEICVSKADGRRLGPYKAVVAKKMIVCLDKTADFDPGDRASRTLPNGKEDVYYVVDATFHDGSGLGREDMSNWEVTTARTAPGASTSRSGDHLPWRRSAIASPYLHHPSALGRSLGRSCCGGMRADEDR